MDKLVEYFHVNDPLISIGLGFLGMLGLFFIPNTWLKIICAVAFVTFFYNAVALISGEWPLVSEIVREWQRIIENAFP